MAGPRVETRSGREVRGTGRSDQVKREPGGRAAETWQDWGLGGEGEEMSAEKARMGVELPDKKL